MRQVPPVSSRRPNEISKSSSATRTGPSAAATSSASPVALPRAVPRARTNITQGHSESNTVGRPIGIVMLQHFALTAAWHPLPDFEVILLDPVLEEAVWPFELHAADVIEPARRLIVDAAVPAAQIALDLGDAGETLLTRKRTHLLHTERCQPGPPRQHGTVRRHADVGVPARRLQPIHAGGGVLHAGRPQKRASPQSHVLLRHGGAHRRSQASAATTAALSITRPKMPPSTPIVASVAACRSAYEEAQASRTVIQR